MILAVIIALFFGVALGILGTISVQGLFASRKITLLTVSDPGAEDAVKAAMEQPDAVAFVHKGVNVSSRTVNIK